MNPIDALTEIDREKFMDYIHLYGSSVTCGLEHLLRHWNREKQWLFDKFNHKLIHSIPIEYRVSEDQLMTDIINKLWDQDERCRKFLHTIIDLSRGDMPSNWPWERRYEYTSFHQLTEPKLLATNRIPRDCTFYLKDGKDYKVQAGTKVMKVLRKIAESYELEDFEYFCEEHSKCLNQKLVKGELCISIHPLDYITMSDNSLNWRTCMNWRDEGEYRQGTLEMMNSPCVAVGYLKSKTDFHFADGTTSADAWNNKKWRCLFIIDNNMILSIKNYPYQNNFLTQQVIQQIARVCGWGNVDTHPFEVDVHQQIAQCEDVLICPTAGMMYNDFDSTDHFIAINPAYTAKSLIDRDYYFSGSSMCVCCGHAIYDQPQDAVMCESCDPITSCACCGNRLHTADDDVTWLDEETPLCPYCFKHETFISPITAERLMISDSYRLYYKDVYTNQYTHYVNVDNDFLMFS